MNFLSSKSSLVVSVHFIPCKGYYLWGLFRQGARGASPMPTLLGQDVHSFERLLNVILKLLKPSHVSTVTTRFQFRWLCPHLHFSTDWYAGKLAFCEIEKPQYLCKKQEPCLWSVRKFLWLFLLILSLWKLYELFPHCASQVPKKKSQKH